MPKAKNNDISEDPPLLMKGNGIPTTGRRPTTMLKLIIRLAAKVKVASNNKPTKSIPCIQRKIKTPH